MVQSKAPIVYTPRADATPESELSTLVAAYRFLLFDCNECEKGARPGARDDAEGLLRILQNTNGSGLSFRALLSGDCAARLEVARA
jgi:hypothetical protein